AHIEGAAYITGVGAPASGSQHVRLVALRAGRSKLWRRVRRRVPWLGIRIRTEEVHRPELTAMVRQQLADLEWAGFRASVGARAGAGARCASSVPVTETSSCAASCTASAAESSSSCAATATA